MSYIELKLVFEIRIIDSDRHNRFAFVICVADV